jgi:polysaccharide pyruvyl transferase WcaK-like protein
VDLQVLDDARSTGDRGTSLAGINVSGLLYNDPGSGARFGLKVDYRRLMRRLVMEMLDRDARIVLVPHVRSKVGDESDGVASMALLDALPAGLRRQVHVMAPCQEPGQIKTLVGELEWFCGTRMHSAIAALSMKTPAAAVAYSIKTRGVFATCGQEERVADARFLDEDEILDVLLRSWDEREKTKAELEDVIPGVINGATAQMDTVLARVAMMAGQGSTPCPSQPADGA